MEKTIPLLVAVLTVFIFLFLIPPIQELLRRFLPEGFYVQVSKYDADYGVSLEVGNISLRL